jgi:molecular chaperone GrpE
MTEQQKGGAASADVERMDQEPTDGPPDSTAVDPIEQVRRERDEYYDRLLRVSAEFDNFRKRMERERRETSERATASVLEELLPIVDDFERALGAIGGGDGESYREGIAIIHRQLLEMLSRRGVRPIEALGADFDPRLHQAVVYEPAPERRDGEIIEELRRGYMMGDRLLRPSMVKVAKA